MAAPNRILSLDLGTQTVAIAEFQTGKNGGLVLTNYRSTELLADPGADATRLSQARMAIGEMAAGMHLKGAGANYTVSSQAVFTRFVKLPSVGEEQVDQIVTFEAQQNVPFPINEVVWDYQLVDSGSSSEVEVVLVAIKSDLLDDINGAIEEGGLKTNTVDVSPMAIYNAFRYNYSDVSECSLIIDIGARTTNLIFIEPNKIFSRSIPIGGTKITEAIAKDFHEPFGAAEERKKRDGFVSLGGTYADPEDPDVARVSKMIRNSMTRLHAEISRSISFYRSQQHGTQPARIFLCGGSASLPYVREFFHEKLQMPVEFFNPLRNVAVGGNLNIDEIGRHAHTLGELVGLALRGISDCPMELNLRPVTVVKRQRLAQQRPFLIMAGTCVLLALAGWWLYYTKAADAHEQVLQKIEPRVNELKSYENRMLAVRTDIKKQEEIAAPFLQALQERQYWTGLLQDLNSRLPKEFIWITSFAPELPKEDPAAANQRPAARPAGRGAPAASAAPKATVTLRGLYLDNPRGASVFDDYIQKLSESDLYEVNKEGQLRSTPDDLTWAYEWGVSLTLKNPIAAK
jgi:type IV pilus assembly protein PilM